MTFEFSTDLVAYRCSDAGLTVGLVERRTGRDLLAAPTPIALVRQHHEWQPATALRRCSDGVQVEFGPTGIQAVFDIQTHPTWFVVTVKEVRGAEAEELVFLNWELAEPSAGDALVGCALALNLQTNILELPQANTRLRAACHARFGFAGAATAVIVSPRPQLRRVLQEVVSAAPALPHSPLGGPWALDAASNRGSYLFNFGGLNEQTADGWIAVAQSLGFTQIDFHGGRSFRFGDCHPNPETYPEGRASLKRTIDRLHAAGLMAGLHTYAFFIDKRCPWVTPVPDPRLGSDAVFTLAAFLPPEADTVPVVETTAAMHTTVGFFVRNSVTLRIDDELITFGGVTKEPPYRFTKCQRGAWGTHPGPHWPGAKAFHLKECFGLFCPDGDSRLLAEVAACTAETFNECGFDMMYMDALDGEDIFAGRDHGWHYGSKFVFEIWKRLRRPAMMEMSTFHHHLWYVRSRMGAWDHPSRAHQPFIDNHCAVNDLNERMFLPGHLGWWAVLPFAGPDHEPTFMEDMEYLCVKALATDTGFSIMGINPETLPQNAGLARIAALVRRYEAVRHAGTVSAALKAQLREPGRAFTLVSDGSAHPVFRPVTTHKRVFGGDASAAGWTVMNPGPAQPLRLRFEALYAAAPYASPEAVTLLDFAAAGRAEPWRSADEVKAGFTNALERTPAGEPAVCCRFRNQAADPREAWTVAARTFAPPLALGERKALGVWVRGDGSSALLDFRLKSPVAVSRGLGVHYLTVDFTGWRYIELLEIAAERFIECRWPDDWPPMECDSENDEAKTAKHWLMGQYEIYRESVHYDVVEGAALWVNNLPRQRDVALAVGPLRALPATKTRAGRPALTVNGTTVVFPVELETGQYLECDGSGPARWCGPDHRILGEIAVPALPPLRAGANELSLRVEPLTAGPAPRTRVAVFALGEPLTG